jgi:hypothetical protein
MRGGQAVAAAGHLARWPSASRRAPPTASESGTHTTGRRHTVTARVAALYAH